MQVNVTEIITEYFKYVAVKNSDIMKLVSSITS